MTPPHPEEAVRPERPSGAERSQHLARPRGELGADDSEVRRHRASVADGVGDGPHEPDRTLVASAEALTLQHVAAMLGLEVEHEPSNLDSHDLRRAEENDVDRLAVLARGHL